MKKHFMFAVHSFAIACMTSMAVAQESAPVQANQNNQVTQPNSGNLQGSNQRDNNESNRQSSTQGLQTTPQDSTRRGNQNANQSAQLGGQHQSQSLEKLLVGSLIQKNQGEVEMGKLAQQYAQDQKVKQFAQMMVQSHTKLISDLQELKSGSNGAALRVNGGDSTSDSNARSTERAEAIDRNSNATNNELGTNLSPGNASDHNQGAAVGQHYSSGVDSQLASVLHEACAKHQKMTKEMLTKYKGSEFDMAYIGQQIAAHTMMLANLEAFKDKGDREFQQVVQKAKSETESHLQQAESIANNLKGDNSQR